MKTSAFSHWILSAVVVLFAAALLFPRQAHTEDEQPQAPDPAQPAVQPVPIGGGGFGGGFGGGGFGGGGFGGGGFGGGGFGAGGFAGGHASLNVLPAAEFAVIVAENKDRVAVYNAKMGEWHFQAMAKAVTPEHAVVPLIGQNLVFVWGDGNYYAYSVMQGTWQAVPAKEKLKLRLDGPIVSANMASLILDNHVYAFSAFTGTWEKLEIPVAEENGVAHAGNYLYVTHGDVISAFSAETGKWSSINFKLAKPVNWKVEPKPE